MYQLIKLLLKITLHSYFRSYSVKNRPKKSFGYPVIFVANHPSTFLDPMVIASNIHETLYFISAGEYFGKGFKRWFYKHIFHMIPVYRPSTMPDMTHKNETMFKSCYEHLKNGNSILIFPEGNSITEKRLRELKTGVSRIALGAEASNNFSLKINIVPIGLNYSNPHLFRSDLHVNFGNAIEVCNYKDEYNKNQKTAIHLLTKNIEIALKTQMLHIEHKNLDNTIQNIEQIFSSYIKENLHISKQEHQRLFEMQKGIIKAVEFFSEHSPDLVTEINKQIDTYQQNQHKLGISNIFLEKAPIKPTTTLIQLIVRFPLNILGLINNFIPYFGVKFFLKKLNIETTFTGAMAVSLGMLFFVTWYILMSCLLSVSTHLWWISFTYPILMYLSGLHTLRYTSLFHKYNYRKKFIKRVENNTEEIARLILERKKLIEKLSSYQDEYYSLQD